MSKIVKIFGILAYLGIIFHESSHDLPLTYRQLTRSSADLQCFWKCDFSLRSPCFAGVLLRAPTQLHSFRWMVHDMCGHWLPVCKPFTRRLLRGACWRIVGLWHFVYCATTGESSRMVLGSSLPFQSTELSTTMMPIDKHLIVSVLKQPSPTSCKRQKNRLSFTTPPLKKSWPLPWKSTEIPECCADFMAILSSNPACRRSSKKISPNS